MKVIERYGIRPFIGVVILVGIMLFSYLAYQTDDSRLIYAEMSKASLNVSCGSVEKSGKRYLRIDAEAHGRLTSVGRISNCEAIESNAFSEVRFGYHKSSNAIYYLSIDGRKIITPDQVRSKSISTSIMMYVVFCMFVFGVYIDLKRKAKNNTKS